MDEKDLPAITVLYDEKAQGVTVQFAPEHFRNWRFVEAVLRMAATQAASQAQMMEHMAAAQQMQQVAQERALAKKIMLGR